MIILIANSFICYRKVFFVICSLEHNLKIVTLAFKIKFKHLNCSSRLSINNSNNNSLNLVQSTFTVVWLKTTNIFSKGVAVVAVVVVVIVVGSTLWQAKSCLLIVLPSNQSLTGRERGAKRKISLISVRQFRIFENNEKYSVSHRFRLIKRDGYFWVTFDPFW
jgi:hypothetical protein